ncbi:hypothetical protein [Vibrio litoralis]|uniref:hypothetical protein n=1 Tax=Vibrio litoralis TaxID=335972 RepID=UPI001866C234|nr:hypothetical protein [Vibrio litoralis]
MLKKLLLATTVCIALSACNDSSSSSNTEPPEPLATLTFENLSNVSSIARVETSSEDGSHLIGFDENGLEFDISNYDVDSFTPTSDGGFVVEVTDKHKATYKYTQSLSTVDPEDEDSTALEKLIEAITSDSKDIVDVTQTFRRPVWYYVTPDDDYYLISEQRNLPTFIGENSDHLLIFSNGETFNLNTKRTNHLFSALAVDKLSLISDIASLGDDSDIRDYIQVLIDNGTVERIKTITDISGDTLLTFSEKDNKPVLISTVEGGENSNISVKTEINETSEIANITQLPISIQSSNILLGQGVGTIDVLARNPKVSPNEFDNWDGETSIFGSEVYQLRSQDCTNTNQCLVALSKDGTTTTVNQLNFESLSTPGLIEGGQQNYLWVNDNYIVIKEKNQISIIDKNNSNALLSPILVGHNIDTISLTNDDLLYITASETSEVPEAYIYDIKADTGLDIPFTTEKLHALKALIK